MSGLLTLLLYSTCLTTVLTSNQLTSPLTSTRYHKRNLIAEPDFRSVTLRWQTMTPSDISLYFRVTTCEIYNWSPTKCKTQDVKESRIWMNDRNRKTSGSLEHRSWNTSVKDLRIGTSYSFQVQMLRLGSLKEVLRAKKIQVSTKGFSASAKDCTGRSSRVEVETGPNFGGLISVENSTDPQCSVTGNATSSKSIYNLLIDYETCKGIVNESSVAFPVIVQEKMSVVTQTTKKFVVVCHYQPGNVLVQTEFQMPVVKRGFATIQRLERIEDLRPENLQQEIHSAEGVSPVNFVLFLVIVFSMIVVFVSLSVGTYVLRQKCRHRTA